MHKNVTAIYRTHAVAEQVKEQIADLGISTRHIDVVPNRMDEATHGAPRDPDSYRSDLDHLGLPEDERHLYDHALRRGDHVVSVRVNHDDEKHINRISEIMRHPEAHDLDALDAEFRDEPRGAHNAGPGVATGRRDTDTDYGGPAVRGYAYDTAYSPRTARA
ncbi:hypothetical protein [Jannaschia formosa]|uniref:hypothetical protein n=1 Tax=Jannaschia formosa TaxID=2259592 RepID=UPI000E1BA07D|nr:hypothetical protein [Jannaschia formosa]TFL18871.1 hypothetical protein DR046_08100 [Jannaschia formosa]